MKRALFILVGAVYSSSALAVRPALDPLNRLHLGASMSDASTVGFGGGFDSRLTRLVYVDVGAFISPMNFPETDVSSDNPADFVFLRHGIYVAPGIRIPHKEKGSLSWDLIGRWGMGSVWSVDVDPENFVAVGGGLYEVEADPTIFLGLDGQLRKDRYGLRGGAKGYLFQISSQAAVRDEVVVKPQMFLEGVVEW